MTPEPEKSAEQAKDHFQEKGITVAMYVVYNQESGEYGVIGAPGFLDDKTRAYFALWMAEKQLDKFYAKKEAFFEKMVAGARTFKDKMAFRGFWGAKKN
jgi:hypothetical protein